MRMPSSMSSLVEISSILVRCDNLVPAQKSWSVQFKTKQKLTFKFSTLFTAKDIDLMYLKYFGLKIYRNEYRMDNNGKTGSDIEATRPVLR